MKPDCFVALKTQDVRFQVFSKLSPFATISAFSHIRWTLSSLLMARSTIVAASLSTAMWPAESELNNQKADDISLSTMLGRAACT